VRFAVAALMRTAVICIDESVFLGEIRGLKSLTDFFLTFGVAAMAASWSSRHQSQEKTTEITSRRALPRRGILGFLTPFALHGEENSIRMCLE
jgi:hypothetical protein